MKMHCLGTAGYHPSETRHTSCYFFPEVGLVLDAGSGIFRIAEWIEHETIDILLSHAHLDHVVGLTFLLDLFFASPAKRARVYGEQAKLDAIRKHLFSPLIFPIEPDIEWIALERMPAKAMVAGAELTWFPLEHPGGSVGYRLEWPNSSFAYVTDTTATSEAPYWDVVNGCHTLLHECNFREAEREFAIRTGHSCPSDVVQGAVRSNVQHLILGHMNPLFTEPDPVESEARHFLGSHSMRLASARDGLTFEIGSLISRE